MFELAFIWVVFSAMVGLWASSRGYSGFLWFLFALLLSPLVMGIGVALLPKRDHEQREDAQRSGQSDLYRKCPQCAEPIRYEALKCRYCGSAVEQPSAHLQS